MLGVLLVPGIVGFVVSIYLKGLGNMVSPSILMVLPIMILGQLFILVIERCFSKYVSWIPELSHRTKTVMIFAVGSMFALECSKAIPIGMTCVLAGAWMNCLAITTNGFRMPVLSRRRKTYASHSTHTLMRRTTRFKVLCDWIQDPFRSGSMVSPGDLTIFIGVYVSITEIYIRY